MSHSHHEQLHGYNPSQLLIDNCGECEYRAGLPDHGLAHLDRTQFEAAWGRAAAWNRTHGLEVSNAEVPLLNLLWSVQVQLERLGVPLGSVPLPEPHIAMRRPA